MKTPEDEAFDDLARRQGMWGGGFPAKRAMAADKLQEPVSFPCCGYTDAIKWNQFNGVVQCHMCGQIYTASNAKQCFTTPLQRPWVGLTDEQRLTALKFIDPQTARFPLGFKQFAEAIEQLLKEKNT